MCIRRPTTALLGALTIAAYLLGAASAVARAIPENPVVDSDAAATIRARAWWQLFRKLDLEPEVAQLRACLDDEDFCDGPALSGWRRAIEHVVVNDAIAVSRAMNDAIAYRSDSTGHWQGPLHAITGGGDCEDLAVAKMITLIALGYEPSHLHVIILRARRSDAQDHALLMVERPQGPLFLDPVRGGVRTPGWILARYRPDIAYSGDGSVRRLRGRVNALFHPRAAEARF